VRIAAPGPDNLQGIAPFPGDGQRFGADPDPAPAGRHRLDPGHFFGRLLLIGCRLGPESRRPGHGGKEHAGSRGVQTETGGAAHFLLQVQPLELPADVAELGRFLQAGVLGDIQPGRLAGKLPVGQAPAALLMTDGAQLIAALAHRHAPRGRRRGHQHLPGRGSRLAEHLVHVADAGAAPGGLAAPDRVLVGVARRRRLHAHPTPVGVQFVGHDHGQGGVHPLAHLGLVDNDDDGLIGPHLQPDARLQGGARPGQVGRGKQPDSRGRDRRGDGQGSGHVQEFSAGQIGLHFFPPVDARRTALRMRG